jgi:chromosome condensin MukBEF ATPase and DNA-binding subunit MukB
MSVNSNRSEVDERSQQLADESAQNNAQIAGALQPVRVAIAAIQNAETAQFNALAAKAPGQPLRDALTAVQNQRTEQFHAIGRQLNVAAGLPPAFPNK